MPTRLASAIQISWLTGYCPVQALGRVDGLPWYFRARGGYWVFSVAQTPESDPVAVSLSHEPGYRLCYPYGRPGESDAGLMLHSVAQDKIYQCARLYLAQKARGEM
jgi:hypothetical protein